MCRSIKQLRVPDDVPTDAEIQAAALQFVRKVSGYRAPSRANREAFDSAVAEIAQATRRLLDQIGSPRVAEHSHSIEVVEHALRSANKRE